MLDKIGYTVVDEVKEYAINEILDWVINSQNIDEKCYRSLRLLHGTSGESISVKAAGSQILWLMEIWLYW